MPADLDTIAPNFRRAKEQWPDAPTLANHYQAVVDGYVGNGHGLVETVKSFLECVCVTVLGEFGKPMPSSQPGTTELLVECLKCLGLTNTRGASKLDKVLSAHNKLADALSDMRNEAGPVAHGKDGFLDALTSTQIRAYLLTADTLLALLIAALEGTEPDINYTREPYERFVHLHERIDQAVTVSCEAGEDGDIPTVIVTMTTGKLKDGVELRIEPSRLLYAIDRTAYLELLAASSVEAEEEQDEADQPDEVAAPGPAPAVPDSVPVQESAAVEAAVNTHAGELSHLSDACGEYVNSLSLPFPAVSPPIAEVAASLLAAAERHLGLDWSEREPLQAAMRVAIRQIFSGAGVPDPQARKAAEHVVSWLKIQTAAGSGPTAGEVTDVQ